MTWTWSSSNLWNGLLKTSTEKSRWLRKTTITCFWKLLGSNSSISRTFSLQGWVTNSGESLWSASWRSWCFLTNGWRAMKTQPWRTCSTRTLLQQSKWENTLSTGEYENFCAKFHKWECVTMMDWLREYNLADVVPFVEAVKRTQRQYYDNEIDILKDAVSIPGVSMRYVLNKSLKLNLGLELYAPGEPCKYKCEESCKIQNSCNKQNEWKSLWWLWRCVEFWSYYTTWRWIYTL